MINWDELSFMFLGFCVSVFVRRSKITHGSCFYDDVFNQALEDNVLYVRNKGTSGRNRWKKIVFGKRLPTTNQKIKLHAMTPLSANSLDTLYEYKCRSYEEWR